MQKLVVMLPPKLPEAVSALLLSSQEDLEYISHGVYMAAAAADQQLTLNINRLWIYYECMMPE